MDKHRIFGEQDGIGRIAHDAVHRRLVKNDLKNSEEKEKDQDVNQGDHYFCNQCRKNLSGMAELKVHFSNVRHSPRATCVYCSKPVYEYKYKGKFEVYHACQHD